MWWLFLGCDFEAAPKPGNTEQLVFDVPKGSTARGLGDELAAAGLVGSETNWEWFLRMGADGNCIKAGKHRVGPGMSAPELLKALCGVPLADDVPFTVVEGWRIRDIDAALVEKGWIKPGDYIAAAGKPLVRELGFPVPTSSLEGYLFPETYLVPPDGFDAGVFVQRQLDTFGIRWGKQAAAAAARPFDQVVIVASMLEREEPSPKNRPMVAGIMWKRLDNGWHLGIDATSRYTIADWNNREDFMVQLRDPTDPYNTRLRPGLPPTPIGNPGLASLEAAANATESEFWYYLHDSTGTLHPSRNVAEHEAYRRKYNVY